MNKIYKLAICFFMLGNTLAVLAQGEKSETKASIVDKTAHGMRLVNEPGEIVAVLPNGMVAIVKENHTAPVAAVRLYVRAGSIYEGKLLGAGMSHLFEHLMAGGSTSTRTDEQSKELIQSIGASFNAYTSNDRTCYFLTAPAQHVDTALNLITDWLINATFTEKEFEREHGVVQRELEMYSSDPRWVSHALFDQLRYKVHPGQFPVVGHKDILKTVTNKDIKAYRDRVYIPDNCVIVVAGDINADKMLSKIEQELVNFKRKPVEDSVLPVEPEIVAPRSVVKVFPAMKGPAQLQIGFPSIKLQDADLYALDTLASIIGDGRTSRLYRGLVEEKQLALSVMSYNYTPHWAEGTFAIICSVMPEKVEAVKTAIWQELDRVVAQGVEPAELARAKRRLQVEHIQRNQTAEQQASTMAEDYFATGDVHFSRNYIANMQKVTASEVQAMAKKYLDANKQLTLVLTPTALPKSKEEVAKKTTETPVKKIVLDNGLRVLLKRNSTVPMVSMQMFFQGGLLNETADNNGITTMMTSLSTKGTRSYSARDIDDYFANVGGQIGASSGNNVFSYTSEVMTGDFDKAFDIFSEVVTAAVFPQDELDKLRPRLLANIAQIPNDWNAAGSKIFLEQFFVKSPYRLQRIGESDSVKTITREQLIAFHKQVVLGKRGVLAIYGDIDLEKTEAVVRQRFGSIEAGEMIDLAKFEPEPVRNENKIYVAKTEKNGATVHIGYTGMKCTEIKDRYPMSVLMELVGSSSGWLFEQLRGKQLVYSTWAYSSDGYLPGFILATAQCEGQKAPLVLNIIQEQLANAAAGKITEEEIARAKSKLINAEVLSKLTNADAAGAAAIDELFYQDYNWSRKNADRVMAVTREDVLRVAKKYLSGKWVASVNTNEPERFK
ncbi:MAG: insulinase family protein [Phycisphaerae bacterium]|nr:insulinase family protein [Phycisphaerae bacterium]